MAQDKDDLLGRVRLQEWLLMLLIALTVIMANLPSEFLEKYQLNPNYLVAVLSCAVIFRLLWSHPRLFRHISRLSGWLVAWSAVWTFAIVLLPIPTAAISAFRTSAGTVLFYGASLAREAP